jgi:hypothetical protein
MDTTTILITVVVLILCALPIVLMQRNKTKKENAFKEKMVNLGGNGNTKIHQLDRWNNKGIGIDNDNHKLFFLFSKQDTDVQKVINLSEIRQCSLVKSHHTGNNESSTGIKKLELHLLSKEKSKPNVVLEFYDADHDSLTIREELQLAEKWSSIIESGISKMKATN